MAVPKKPLRSTRKPIAPGSFERSVLRKKASQALPAMPKPKPKKLVDPTGKKVQRALKKK